MVGINERAVHFFNRPIQRYCNVLMEAIQLFISFSPVHKIKRQYVSVRLKVCGARAMWQAPMDALQHMNFRGCTATTITYCILISRANRRIIRGVFRLFNSSKKCFGIFSKGAKFLLLFAPYLHWYLCFLSQSRCVELGGHKSLPMVFSWVYIVEG